MMNITGVQCFLFAFYIIYRKESHPENGKREKNGVVPNNYRWELPALLVFPETHPYVRIFFFGERCSSAFIY